jgi:TRAP transporter 4TM/12TM fusion protein
MTDPKDLNQLPDLIKEAESGARWIKGPVANTLWTVCFIWSLFQFWYASPLPFYTGFFILNDMEARALHLGFALFLAFILYPAFRTSSKKRVPLFDMLFALIGSLSSVYLLICYESLADRPGMPLTQDLIAAGIGIVLLLEATRRTLGLPLMVIASVALAYLFFGPYMPGILVHKGVTLEKALGHQWLSSEGVFGIALGVSTSFVFLFVLFGALLEKAGAGNYFIRLAFVLLGRFRGGPAKAAIVASGLTGLISGSSVANVVTTGTFTIPLMKKVGFSGVQAAAIEAATGINGQIMPPVMGAAAFLMVEYVGIPYSEVCKHAIVPAIISYIALLYMVHLEATKMGMTTSKHVSPFKVALLKFAINTSSFLIFSSAVYYGFSWIKDVLKSNALYLILPLLTAFYLFLVKLSSKDFEDTQKELDPKSLEKMLDFGPIFKSGLHFLLPVFILVWCLVIERQSPGLSAFWAIVFLLVIMLTQRPLMVFFNKQNDYKSAFLKGVDDFLEGMVAGARGMIGIGIATATAGIIVGVVSLSGVGLKMTALVELLSGGNIFIMLVLTALLSLILGMGLPTTANYILVSTLMAPVLVELGSMNGLVLPLIAVHLFVFYFGIMADVTPPVGLASFAAAAVAGSDPIKTSIKAAFYSLRTVVLPFFFVYNTHLLLIDVDNWFYILLTLSSAMIGMMVLSAAFENFMIVRNRVYETLAMFAIAFTLFVPQFWMNMVYPEYVIKNPQELMQVIEDKDLKKIRFDIAGENIAGEKIKKTVLLSLSEGQGSERFEKAGVKFRTDPKRGMIIDQVEFRSQAEKSGFSFDWTVQNLSIPSKRPSSEWLFIPALLLLCALVYSQRRREKQTLKVNHVS